ncbi:hypothetical protein ACO34A_15280 [Rhizobium sp. ACO-34A]|nr:hypothetical protein [Rhizobium sp. ACO-34A]ATN35166.1 hypothetical protein ACO34A_15280 [Rhizobium sp. ACO-34A]
MWNLLKRLNDKVSRLLNLHTQAAWHISIGAILTLLAGMAWLGGAPKWVYVPILIAGFIGLQSLGFYKGTSLTRERSDKEGNESQ